MKKGDISDNLKLAIATLEARQKEDMEMIKEDLHEVYESLKPINVIKSTFNSLKESPELMHNLTNVAIGNGIGFIVRKLFFRDSKSPLRNLAGVAVESLASKIAMRYSDRILGMVQHLISSFSSGNSKRNVVSNAL